MPGGVPGGSVVVVVVMSSASTTSVIQDTVGGERVSVFSRLLLPLSLTLSLWHRA